MLGSGALFGIPENCVPVWVKKPLPLPPLDQDRITLGKELSFLVSFGADDVNCYCFWLSAPKEFLRFPNSLD